MQPKPNEMAVLVGLPPGFVDDLPPEEQVALSAMVGKPIYVDPSFIRPVEVGIEESD